MFGYVQPCKMELKVKDLERFKAYYCGLCKSIKKNYGNLPRFTLNYDMTFLAVLLDGLLDEKSDIALKPCMIHPVKKHAIIVNSSALDYAALNNVVMSYYKLLDDVLDEKSFISNIKAFSLNSYIKKCRKNSFIDINYIEDKLKELNKLEKTDNDITLDEVSHPFSDLIGYIISSFYKIEDAQKENLYWLGYNLGKWIYIIDAFDDLKKDMDNKKFNPINYCLNKQKLPYNEFKNEVEKRIDFLLTCCASECFNSYNSLDIKKNKELLDNILQLGLVEKMEMVFKKECNCNERSI